MSERLRHIPTTETYSTLAETWAEYHRYLARNGINERNTQAWKDKVNARAKEEVFSGIVEPKASGSRR